MPQKTPPEDRLIRDIPLIARYSRNNEANDLRFRTFLKLELSLPNAGLDAVVRQTTDEVWREFDCTTCANCCKVLQVVVDNADIRRLAERRGVSFRQFGRRYVRVGPDKTKYLASTPCMFLGEDNRCTVYEDRPKACRDFPYLHDAGFRNHSLMMIENCATCPIVFNVWQRLKARLWRRRRNS